MALFQVCNKSICSRLYYVRSMGPFVTIPVLANPATRLVASPVLSCTANGI